MKMRMSNNIPKPLDQWNNKDFVMYFSNRLFSSTGKGLQIDPVAWPGFTGRIKGFRAKLNLSPAQYKEFIDKVFDQFFTKDNYIPTFGSIVSERVYYVVKKFSTHTSHVTTNEEFLKLRNELYQNNLLFARATV